jgi:ABC-type branched-subunit amino acid transport system ATPase component
LSAPLLEVVALEAGYDDALILRGVDLTAAEEEIVAIVGPNGAGKSTLLKAIYGLVRPSGGSVRFAGDDVTAMRADRLTRRGMNFVPQVENVFPTMTVMENLHVGSLVRPRAERQMEIDRVLALFPLLADRRRQRAGSLSGGQRKLIALGRALVAQPRLLLLDEPSAGLSPIAIDLVFEKLVEIRALGIAIVMVEQNARRALALADRGYVLDTGRNAYTGAGRDLLTDPRVVELYLGGSGSATMASSSTSTSTPSGMNPAT